MLNINWCVCLNSSVRTAKGMARKQVKLLKPCGLNKVILCRRYYARIYDSNKLKEQNKENLKNESLKHEYRLTQEGKLGKKCKVECSNKLEEDKMEKLINKGCMKMLKNREGKRNRMNLQGIMEKLNACTAALNKGNTELKTLGLMKAQTEKAYRIKLAEEILKLREEKYPAVLVMELAKGNAEVAELRLQRDIAGNSYYTCISAIENLRLEIDTIKSKLKWLRAEISLL